MGTMTIYGLKTTTPANHFTKMDTTRIRVYFIKKKERAFLTRKIWNILTIG